MDETVNATEVNEYTVVGDVLDGTLKYLTLLKLADELASLLLLLCFEKCLVRNDNIAELLIDLDNLEVDWLINVCIVVTDRLDVNL